MAQKRMRQIGFNNKVFQKVFHERPQCPKCKKPLESISETFQGEAYYQWSEDYKRYIYVDDAQTSSNTLKCNDCGYLLKGWLKKAVKEKMEDEESEP